MSLLEPIEALEQTFLQKNKTKYQNSSIQAKNGNSNNGNTSSFLEIDFDEIHDFRTSEFDFQFLPLQIELGAIQKLLP